MNEISVPVVAAAVKLQNFEVKIDLNALGCELIEMIRNFTGQIDIKLLHKGRNVVDDKTLKEQGVGSSSKIIVVKTAPNPSHLQTSVKPSKTVNSSPKIVENSEKSENIVKCEENEKNSEEKVKTKNVKSETISIFESDLSNLFVWGSNIGGKLGLSSSGEWLIPYPLSFPSRTIIKQVSCGALMTVAISESGHLFVWGKRVYPQNSNPSFKNENTPCRINELDNIRFIKVSAGNNHVLALDSRGDVWSWGENKYGELGHNNNTNEFYPKRIALLEGFRILDICAGGAHSAAVSKSRKCFAWGANSARQVGMFKENSRLEPSLLLGMSADTVRCGSAHTVWNDQGKVTYFGSKQEHRLIFENCKYLESGGEKTFIQDDHSEIHIFESGEFSKKEKIPSMKQISSNGSDILVMTHDNLLISRGTNKHGELGIGSKVSLDTWSAVEINGKVESVSCGTSHVAAVVSPDDLTSCMFSSNFTSDSKLFCNDGVIEVNSFLLSSHSSPLELFGQTSEGFRSNLSVAVASYLVRWLYSRRLSFEIPLEELEILHQFSLSKNLQELVLDCKSEMEIKYSAANYLLNFPEESIEIAMRKMTENEVKALEDLKKENERNLGS